MARESEEELTRKTDLQMVMYDFYFDRNGNFVQTEGEQGVMEGIVADLLTQHQAYHKRISDTRYVPVGSVLACTNGSTLVRMGAGETTGVYVGNGAPVMTCSDCKAGENIPTFGGCRAIMVNGLPGRKLGAWGNVNAPAGESYTPFGAKCVPVIDGEWKQPGKGKVLIWRPAGKEYSCALKKNAVLTCRYGGIIGVVEISDDMREDQDEKVQLSPWLFGKKGEPSRQDISHVIEGNALLREKRDDLGKSNIPIYGAAFIDWYSFMGGVSKYLKNQYINSGKTPVVNRISDVEVISEETYIYVNDDMRYWIGVGPEVAYYNYHIDYPGEAATVGEEQFKLGSEIDVVLRNKEEPGSSLVYIECILGMLKAHTYAEDYVNGVFQTGKAYPYSAQANENGDAHRDGSYVEFLRVKEGENEKFPDEKNWRMSDYVVEKIIVYKRGW